MIKPVILLASATALMTLSACATDGYPTVPDRNATQCDAGRYQQYIGKGRDSVPAAPQGVTYRHVFKGGAMTADYNGSRVNFVYDDQNRIEAVRCG